MIFPIVAGCMTPERLHRIRAVYEAAVLSPPAAREALLDHECDGDEELRKEVELLLGARVPPSVAAPLAVADVAASAASTITHPPSAGHIRFPPGTVLGQR